MMAFLSNPTSAVSTGKTVVALSGFLGRAQDWSLIPDLLPLGWRLETRDLLDVQTIADFDEWARQFVRSVPKGSILVGYSMGGRLALQALLAKPEIFRGAIIVSANPGLVSKDEARLRVQADEIWAQKFISGEWSQLMNEWNSQAALRPPRAASVDTLTLVRNESDFDRAALAMALRTWSLGVQRNLRADVANLSMPIEYVTGQDDLKFTAIARDLVAQSAKGERRHSIVSGAGHRVPWDAPIQFRELLAGCLARW